MQPGWYDDPFSPAAQRWWDGTTWTAHVAPRSAGSWPADAAGDLRQLDVVARRALVFVVVAAVVAIIQYVLAATLISRVIHDVVDQVRALDANPDSAQVTIAPGDTIVLQLFGLVSLGAQVFFVIWLYRAATIARRIGLPARREPVWAWVGFLVPIVNFWFPYQVAADVFPPGDPARRLAARWWTFYLLQGAASVPIVVVSYFSVPVALVCCLGLAVLPVLAAGYARALIRTAVASHHRLLGARS